MIADPWETIRDHGLQLALAVGAVVAWAVTELSARRSTWRQGAPLRPPSDRDRGTYPAIVAVVVTGLAVSAIVWLTGIGGYLPPWTGVAGLGLVGAGLGLRGWALRTLGQFFTMPITIREDHRIIAEGPYRWLRHPAYSASILVTVGLPLALGTLVGVLVTLVLAFAIYLYRISVEERALTQRFGEEYRSYRRRTWALVPYVY